MLKNLRLPVIALLVSAGAILLTPLDARAETKSATAETQWLPKSITVLDTPLALKDHKSAGPGGPFIAEYIPADQTFDNWTLLFGSRFAPGDLDPTLAAENTAKRIILKRDAGDPVANAAVFKAPDGKSVVVDFLVSQGKTYEHDIFRFFKTPKGLVSLQIARRIYETDSNDTDIKAFIMSIKTIRNKILDEVMRTNLPFTDGSK